MKPVLIISAVAFAVSAYSTAHALGWLPAFVPALPLVPIEPFQLTSFALVSDGIVLSERWREEAGTLQLSRPNHPDNQQNNPHPLPPPAENENTQALLLVFRTNGAYARWHEARCVFGRISDAARDIFRQVGGGFKLFNALCNKGFTTTATAPPTSSHPPLNGTLPPPSTTHTPHAHRQVLAVFPRDRPESRALMARWLVAYCFASKWALREEGRNRGDLEGYLTPKELDTLVSAGVSG